MTGIELTAERLALMQQLLVALLLCVAVGYQFMPDELERLRALDALTDGEIALLIVRYDSQIG
jgi:hypothetical protein